MAKKFVRWLGAFRNGGSLHGSLDFELNRNSTDEVAVEPFYKKSRVAHARVGLLVDKKAIVKEFSGDCWSEPTEEGKLQKTRNPREAKSTHREAWANPHYVGVVIKGRKGSTGYGSGYNPRNEGFHNLPKKVRSTIKWYADLYNLPVYNLDVNGKLRKVKL